MSLSKVVVNKNLQSKFDFHYDFDTKKTFESLFIKTPEVLKSLNSFRFIYCFNLYSIKKVNKLEST